MIVLMMELKGPGDNETSDRGDAIRVKKWGLCSGCYEILVVEKNVSAPK